MAILETKVLKSSPDFKSNREEMLQLLEECRDAEERVRKNSIASVASLKNATSCCLGNA